MKTTWLILNKVMVKQFYLQNAGLFLFAFLFLFGIVDAGHLVSYHRSLILSIISLPLFLFVVMLVWLLYNIKCIAFAIAAVQSADGIFLHQLRALPSIKQCLLYAGINILLYLPVIIYACVLAIFSYHINKAVTWQVCSWMALMVLVSTTFVFIAINSTKESILTQLTANIRRSFSIKIGYTAFSLAYIFNKKKAAFAVVKVFSLLMLGMLLVRNENSFDEDLFDIFYPLTITAHASLVLYCVDFNETFLHNNRNLPLHWLQVAMMYIFTWCIILLPEICFMFINNHGNLPVIQIAMQSVTAIVVLFLYTGISLGSGLDMERYLLFVFMSYLMILILQKAIGHVLAAAAIAALSAMVFKAHYYSFERELKK